MRTVFSLTFLCFLGLSLCNDYANDFERHVHQLTSKDRAVRKLDHYFAIYERHFAPLRNALQSGRFPRRKLRMLEMGVQSGGSLDMWKAYFGDNLELHGLDINPRCIAFADPARDITIHIGATSDADFMRELVKQLAPLDIVIDDASHHSADILAAFGHLYSAVTTTGVRAGQRGMLSEGGVYLVEDLMTNYWHGNEFKEGPGTPGTFVETAKALVDQLNAHNAYNFSKGRPKWPTLTPNAFTNSTTGISFYDGVIVLEKGPHQPFTSSTMHGGKTVVSDKVLEHRRPSEEQVALSRKARQGMGRGGRA